MIGPHFYAEMEAKVLPQLDYKLSHYFRCINKRLAAVRCVVKGGSAPHPVSQTLTKHLSRVVLVHLCDAVAGGR
jgi:hypothetical protein